MHILLCGVSYPPHLNGQASFSQGLAEGLAARGHEVLALVPREPGYPRRQLIQGVRVVRIPAINLAGLHPDLRMPVLFRGAIRRALGEFRPQLVHLQDPSPFCQSMRRAARRQGVPVLITHHPGAEIGAPYLRSGASVPHRLAGWLSWKAVLAHLNHADMVTLPSSYSAGLLAARGLLARVLTIPCGVDLDHFGPGPLQDCRATRQKHGLDPGSILFLYVGRIDAEKKLEVFLQAMARVRHSAVHFAIAGRGGGEAGLRRLARRLGLDARVHFLGPVGRDALPGLLRSADVFVMPGDAESFSIATLEAMSCAKPVLAAGAAALPELVTHGVNGYLFQPGQPAEAARGIEALLARKLEWRAMGLRSLSTAREHSQARFVQDFERAYRLCMHRAREASDLRARKPTAIRPSRSPARRVGRGLLARLLALAASLLLLSAGLLYDQAQAFSNLRLSDLAALDPKSARNLLVISPHPDDELLAAGGLMQAALRRGAEVRVVLVTNGDGQALAPLVIDRRLRPRQADYVDIGRLRQVETLAALHALGVGSDQVTFLGYPDGRVGKLWSNSWQDAAPLTAPYTGANSSPYDNTYNSQASYLGSHLYGDLEEILRAVQPDLVIIPHPEDTNSDHAAVSNFARFSLAGYLASGAYEPPAVLAYLIHYEAYPLPRGDNPSRALLPPAPLANQGVGWLTYSLSETERLSKLQAIRAYSSQQRMMGTYLRSFARHNEIFFELPVIHMGNLAFADDEVLESSVELDHTAFEPARERFSRLVVRSADLISWKAARLGSAICFAAETRGPTMPNLDYRILAKAPDGKTLTLSRQDGVISFEGSHFGTCLDLEALGSPPAIGFSAQARSGVLLDQTAWHFIALTNHR